MLDSKIFTFFKPKNSNFCYLTGFQAEGLKSFFGTKKI